jgi:hypothetical protein
MMKIASKVNEPHFQYCYPNSVMRIWHELDPSLSLQQCLARRVLRAKRIGIPIPTADYV